MWIFGYGSLLWKTNFPYEEKRHGYIKSYIRRFWQASLDHRGTLEKPGRVVTLIYTGNTEDLVWGTAFKVSSHNISRVIEYLDFREKNGYSKRKIIFHPTSPPISGSDNWDENFIKNHNFNDNNRHIQTPSPSPKFIANENKQLDSPLSTTDKLDLEPFYVEAYIAESSNEHFLGPATLSNIARQISLSHGLSGSNLEYLLNLYRTLIDITPPGKAFDPDGHLRDLINCLDSPTTDFNNNTILPFTKCIKCDSISCGGKCHKHLNFLIRKSCSKCHNERSSDTLETAEILMKTAVSTTTPSLDFLPTIKPTKG